MAKPQLRKPKKKVGPVKAIKVGVIDYKDTATLRKFISDRGKIRASSRGLAFPYRNSARSPRLLRTPARWPCCPTLPTLADRED